MSKITKFSKMISTMGVALLAIALLALTGCPDGGDTAPPVITLTGDLVITVVFGSTFTDPGFAVNDNDLNYTGVVTPTITDSGSNEVSTDTFTATAGTYTITYTAPADAAGLIPTPVTRTVQVAPDAAPPVIALTGSNPLVLEVGSTFTDPGFEVNDNDPNYTGVVTPTITDSGSTDVLASALTATAGAYTITYTALADAAGNSPTAVMRTVTVADTTSPVITLEGEMEIRVATGGMFDDPGVKITDNDLNYAGMATLVIIDATNNPIMTINTAIEGTYTITYTAPMDAAGNQPTAVTRMVRVVPVIDGDGDRLIDISTLEELNAMRYNLDGTSYRKSADGTEFLCGTDAVTACIGYELLGNLGFDTPASYASDTVNLDWRPTAGGTAIVAPDSATNAGWEPIGTSGSPFSARFSGNDFAISKLYVRGAISVGLFGSNTGTIEGIGVVDVSIYGGTGASDIVGGLVGLNATGGTITTSYATGGVNGTAGQSNAVGGLVGFNNGTVTASYATGNVDGGVGSIGFVGGLVGLNATGGTITTSYATGGVNGGAGISDFVGGLVGDSIGTVTASYATGDVNGGAGSVDSVGGLVGNNRGTLIASYATGNADGGVGDRDSVGALLGESSSESSSTASYGFGTETGETAGVTRSDDATGSSTDTPPGTVDDACDITEANSSTMTGMPDNRWDPAQWNFGTGTAERPFVRHNSTLVRGQPTDRGC